MASETTLEYAAISSLEEAERNPKEHSIGLIEDSITRFGFTIPLLVDENSSKLVAGHGRLKALRRLKSKGAEAPAGVSVDASGEWSAPVLRGISFSDQKEAEAYLLADNRTGEVGGWDEIALSEMLSDLAEEGSLVGVGFDSGDLDSLLDEVGAAMPSEVPDADGNPPRDLGDKKKQIKVVLYADSLAVFEEALMLTGQPNRGEALMEVCRAYLDRPR